MSSPSRFRSLRWQLPLSYAAIALLAVVALGITLLGTLRSFYLEQERVYLSGNAAAIAEEIAPLLAADDLISLQAQVAGFAFLTQTRVQVLDMADRRVLADSEELGSLTPSISVNPEEPVLPGAVGVVEEGVMIVVEKEQIENGEVSSQRTVTRTSRIPAQGSLYGFNLGGEATAVTDRSDLVVETSIVDASGNTMGWLRISQGPAYGRDILRSIAWGWGGAGAVAVMLAALVGWLVSRRLTRPLLGLTAVTARMAAGDLSARANVNRADEVGLLGRSFNGMAEQVEKTINSLRRFTADAAHELHTPLTALQTDLQLLEADSDPVRQQRVARARSQAQRLQDLADSLLELSQLEAETGEKERPSLNLTQLVQTTGEFAASQAEQMNLDFEIDLLDRPLIVQGNEGQLRRALENVLDNSLKFTPTPGKVVLSLAVEGETAVITVRDTGIGIPEADVPQLFNRFHRGRNTAGYPGSGLGLAIVQEIMAGHNGRVIVQSSELGTEIQLTLRVV